ncbi:YfhO family protein [Lachnospira hominis (ex Liu et al. 2021)]|uniref:YfhO family protein n=1 Tax=Lachnospira hominis (ex Liu et al. 2021) TaxID=2763051 RepID=A0ABR7G1V7_9FIRM|nr:YfhO family protein [Lachnospira hominis]MBC5681410.1 YfhO family protein [Lachnospira hominis]
MKDNKSLFQRVKLYAIPGLITCAVIVFIYVFKGIWPFGANRIDYFDNMQQVAPLYAHLWDWMHGKASLWFDWYTGFGTNVSMSISAFSMLSPFNLLLYLFPRTLILESISILTLVKMIFMAVAMYAYINKKYNRLSYNMKVVFSLMYTFCGYTVLYGSCFTPWMDIVALFPLLMLAYENMMQTGKKLFYIIMVAIIFIINYYLGAMSLVYIFLISGAYVLLMSKKEKIKEHAWNLGIGTVAGLGLSCFVLVPVMMQLSGSQRGGSGQGIVSQYIGWIKSAIISDGQMAAFQRWMMLYGMAFAAAVIIMGLKKFKEEKNTIRYMISLLLISLLPIVVEGINLMWHFGSYNGYTLRNGYIVAFTLITVAAYFAQRMFEEVTADKKQLVKQLVIFVVAAAVYAVIYNIIPSNDIILAAFILFIAIFIAAFIFYNKKLKKDGIGFDFNTIIAIVAIEVFIGAYSLIGPPKFYEYEPYQYGDYVQAANEVKDSLDIEESVTERIVNPDISLNANYPLILRRSAMSSFTAALQSDTQSYSKKFGYSKYFLWLLDSGGTVFTNSLFHVTQAVNVNELDSQMYTAVRSDGDYTLYDANYKLPFAMSVNKNITRQDFSGNWEDLHNIFYKALTNDTQDIVNGMSYTKKESSVIREYNVRADGKQAVYINIVDVNNRNTDANASWLISSMHIYVNGEAVLVPTLGDVKNTAYFTDYNNNLVYLGTFENENFTIRVEYDDPWYLKVSEVSFAGLDMDKMQSLVDKHADDYCETSYTSDSLTVKLNGSGVNNMALIPVVYSDNWNVKVNEKKVKAKSVCGLFTGVDIHAGENVIEMTFEPKGKKAGMLISLATLIMMIASALILKFTKLKVPALLKMCAAFIYLELYNIVIVAMFLIPVVAAIPALIYQIVIRLMQLF